MSDTLLKTKLYIPPVRPQVVPRLRLLKQLDESLHRKITLVSAPLGFGKTTLLSEWIHRTAKDGRSKGEYPPSAKVAWVSLDERDNDPVRFWTYVIAALNTVQAKIGAHALTLLHSPQPPPLETTLTTLINALDSLADRFVLVLDDYHVIEAEDIHNTLTFLLDNLPPQMHLVMMSRTDPPLPLTRLRARDQLTELRSADLRFNPTEAATFLHQTMGLTLSSNDITALESRTEGWVAGLQLAALSMKGRNNVQGFVQAFTGSHRYVIDYLAEEVLTRQPELVQDFLLQTSVLNRLSGSLCDAVTGQDNGQEMLELLEATNLFVVPLDDERRWYRYHHLFSDFLLEHLRADADALDIAVLHRRAANWYADDELLEEAVDHALAAEDFDRAVQWIESITIGMLVHGEIKTFLRWLDVLPEESVNTSPRLTLGKAWALGITGRWDKAEPLLKIAEAALNADERPPDNIDIQSMRGEVNAMQSMLVLFEGRDVPLAIRLSHQALEDLPQIEEGLIVRGIITYNLGLAHDMLNDFTEARKFLTQAVELTRSTDNLITTILSLNALASIEEEQGRLYEAANLYEQALKLTCQDPKHDGKHKKPLPIAGRSYIDFAEIRREWNDLETAKEYLVIARELGQAKGALNVLELSHIIMARILQAQGDNAGALESIEKAIALITDMSDVGGWAQAIRARLWLAQGNVMDAVRWAETCQLPLGDDFNYTQSPGEYSTLVRVYLAQEHLEDALALLQQMYTVAQQTDRAGRLVEILMLQSLLLQAQGNSTEARATLAQTLTLAEPGGYIRLFVDEGSPMETLLQSLINDASPNESENVIDYAKQRLAAFGNKKDPHPLPLTSQPLIEPLSERELEVLRLIADGLSNREIAQKLVITVGTTKTHINNIYRKLEVGSRTQALARANQLNLL